MGGWGGFPHLWTHFSLKTFPITPYKKIHPAALLWDQTSEVFLGPKSIGGGGGQTFYFEKKNFLSKGFLKVKKIILELWNFCSLSKTIPILILLWKKLQLLFGVLKKLKNSLGGYTFDTGYTLAPTVGSQSGECNNQEDLLNNEHYSGHWRNSKIKMSTNITVLCSMYSICMLQNVISIFKEFIIYVP